MSNNHTLLALSPIDGRYRNKVEALAAYFSEYALIRYRIKIEIHYFQALCALPLPELAGIDAAAVADLRTLYQDFDLVAANRVKSIERTTNHDVKAVEYLLKEALESRGLGQYKEFVHFGLTSQDINNTAIPLSFKEALLEVYSPTLELITDKLDQLASEWAQVPMLARTHGQPASPTLLGKEMAVFSQRLRQQYEQLISIPHQAKFGGATGNFNAHYCAYPEIDWHQFADEFVSKELGLSRTFPTTQIEPYDHMAAQLQGLSRINTILIDFCRDVWTYISMEYFRQRTLAGEVGSSAMPHKVNPIDFENAEGNLGISNALLGHMAEKLPVSRLQRDLTDSTVLRNLGVPMAHTIIALESINKGMGKLLLNEEQLRRDLDNNWAVLAEPIQTILRKEGYPEPYEALKELTRGNQQINKESIHRFIDQLAVSDALKAELKELSPHTYTGRYLPPSATR
jgi:adenylosuccinate lyase